MRVALVLSVAAGFAFGLVAGAANLVGRDVPNPQPTAVVWSDRVFTSRHDLAVWLEARGSHYSVWALRHPALARRFEPATASPQSTHRAAGATESSFLLIVGSIWLVLVIALGASSVFRRFSRHRRSGRPMFRARVQPNGPVGATTPPVIQSHPLRAALSPFQSLAVSLPRLPVPHRVPWHEWSGALVKLARAANELGFVAARVASGRPLRRVLPKVAWYVTSGLLAFGVGAWVAIYLK